MGGLAGLAGLAGIAGLAGMASLGSLGSLGGQARLGQARPGQARPGQATRIQTHPHGTTRNEGATDEDRDETTTISRHPPHRTFGSKETEASRLLTRRGPCGGR